MGSKADIQKRERESTSDRKAQLFAELGDSGSCIHGAHDIGRRRTAMCRHKWQWVKKCPWQCYWWLSNLSTHSGQPISDWQHPVAGHALPAPSLLKDVPPPTKAHFRATLPLWFPFPNSFSFCFAVHDLRFPHSEHQKHLLSSVCSSESRFTCLENVAPTVFSTIYYVTLDKPWTHLSLCW